jgi:hypothetical protein
MIDSTFTHIKLAFGYICFSKVYSTFCHIKIPTFTILNDRSARSHFGIFISYLYLALTFHQLHSFFIFWIHCVKGHLLAPFINNVGKGIFNLSNSFWRLTSVITFLIPVPTVFHRWFSLDWLSLINSQTEIRCFYITDTVSLWVLLFGLYIIHW